MPKKVTASGQIQWLNEQGQLHREDGPAVENPDGSRMWMRNGQEHREDGPAIETPQRKEWRRHGKLHRDDGPAIEFADGKSEWWRHGRRLTPDQIKIMMERNSEKIAAPFRTGIDHKITMRRGMLKNLKKRPDKKQA